MNQEKKATLVGLCAIILWSLIVGLIKGVSESFGAILGAASIYSIASLFLLFTVGWTPLKNFPKKYLVYGPIFFVTYELCLSLSIGYTTTSRQAIEVGMVNYLWPTLTMTSMIIFTKTKTNWLIAPGIVLSMAGIIWVLGGDEGLDISQMMTNISSNPLSYGMALLGALIWSAYCVVTARMAKGINGITFFFMLVALSLWIKYFFSGIQPEVKITLSSISYLVFASSAMGFGYAAWNLGILKGNSTLLAGASYFTPVLSSLFSSIILATSLGISFWQGTLMVCTGSILCWLSTRIKI